MLSEIRDRGLASVAARKNQRAALLAAAKSAFGCDLPTRPRRAFGRDGLSFVWAGPDQWLAMIDHGPVGGIEPRLAASFKGLASVVDQSDGRAVVRIGGARARAALAKGMPIDLHERAFTPGDAALTFFSHINVHIWQVDETPTYEIAVPRSFVGSFWHWLTEASAEFGYEVTGSNSSA
ncbi:MAG: hypothetical protein JO366_07100 [Methylobacteriaceae bacterium]|nr:hypothetical protein [Methylobacteriaceae bacterium]